MVNLRSSTRPDPSQRTSRSVTTRADARASSSSATTSRALQSDENAPSGRRVLGDIKNVVAESKAVVEARSSRRKPLSDRNAPIPTDTGLTSGKAKRSAMDLYELYDDHGSERPLSVSTRPKSTQRQTGSKPAAAPKAAASGSRRAQRVETRATPQSDEVDDLSAQIGAASRKARDATSSLEDLNRLSPIDSDDFEYFDVSALHQTKPAQAVPRTAQRDRAPASDDKNSESSAASFHGSSDKENVPPPAAVASARANQRTEARTRAGVLGVLEEDQPNHSTPISTKRKVETETFLDDVFLDQSNRSSQADSPGVARRAGPIPASTQQLLDYQDRGVTKVMAWKAAGHAQAHETPHNSPPSERDDGSVASWPAEGEPGPAADERRLPSDVDDDLKDEFGFFTADHKLRARGRRAYAGSLGGSEPAEDDDGNVFVELPVNTASDDRRLAEQAFGRMSSPVAHRRERSSSIPVASSVILMAAPQAEAPKHEDRTSKRVTRGSKKRKIDAAVDAAIGAAGLSHSSPSPSPEMSPRRPRTRASNARKSTSGIPLKRNEKKEQAVLVKLAAEQPPSPVSSSAPSSPQAARTSKRGADSPATKKLGMDEILGLLPLRKRQATDRRTKVSGSKMKSTSVASTAATASKGKSASSARASSSKAASRSRGKGRKAKAESDDDDDDKYAFKRSTSVRRKARKGKDDDEDDEDSFKQLTSVRPRRKAPKEKTRTEPDSSDEDDRRAGITSSQIHSDDSERTKRLKEFRAAEKYQMEVEDVI